MEEKFTHPLITGSNFTKFILGIFIASIILGIGTGYTLGNKKSSGSLQNISLPGQKPKTAQADSQTFRDFAEGTLRPKPQDASGTYSEGTHLLQRDGGYPVALTSSVVDLSQYEGKKVKVYGETQKALKEGWLMDVGKVEVQ